jgi:hypothetical protein
VDDTYKRDDDPSIMRWREHVTTHDMQRIRATLCLDGHALTVEANSEARMDRMLDTLRALDPMLLGSFPHHDSLLVMNPDRLRASLDLR